MPRYEYDGTVYKSKKALADHLGWGVGKLTRAMAREPANYPIYVPGDEPETQRIGRRIQVRIEGEWVDKDNIPELRELTNRTINKRIREGTLRDILRPDYGLYEIDDEPQVNMNILHQYGVYIKNDNKLPINDGEFYRNIKRFFRLNPHFDTVHVGFKTMGQAGTAFRKIKPEHLETLETFLAEMNRFKTNRVSEPGSDALSTRNRDIITTDYEYFFFNHLSVQPAVGFSGRGYTKPYSPYFELIDYKISKKAAGDNNCLFVILKNVDKERLKTTNEPGEQASTLRKKCGIPEKKLITYADMRVIEQMLNFNIDVYDRDREVIRWGENKGGKQVNILKEEDHCMFITDFKPVGDVKPVDTEIKKNAKDNTATKTIKNPCKECGKELKFKMEYINLFFDIEATVNKKKEAGAYFVGWKVEGGEFYYEKGYNCMERFVRFLSKSPKPGYAYRIIGYNSNRFDNYLLLEQWISKAKLRGGANKYDGNMITGSTIYAMNDICWNKTWDLCEFTKLGLKEACIEYKCKLNKIEGFDHVIPQTWRNNERLDEWVDNNLEKNIEYNKRDVECLEELFNIVDNAIDKLDIFKELIDTTKICKTCRPKYEDGYKRYRIYDYITIAKMAYDTQNRVGEKIHKSIDKEFNDFVRETFFGGRTQSFVGRNKIIEGVGRLALDDVTSLYPTVMWNGLYPTGPERKVDCEEPEKMGFYNVKIKNQIFKEGGWTIEIGDMTFHKPTKVPNRVENEPLDWDYRGEMDVKLNSNMIAGLRKHGVEIEVGSGYVIDETSDNLFHKYISCFRDEKTKQDVYKKSKDDRYNPGVRNMCKLFLNALSGKYAQRYFKEDRKICTGETGARAFIKTLVKGTVDWRKIGKDCFIIEGEKLEKNLTYKPSIIASYIYSYANEFMYDKIYSKYPVFYTDTDSALVNWDTHELMVKDGLFGKHFGGLTNDLEDDYADKAIIIAPKTYWIGEGENTVKSRAKGVRASDKWIVGTRDKADRDWESKAREVSKNVCDTVYSKALSEIEFKQLELEMNSKKPILMPEKMRDNMPKNMPGYKFMKTLADGEKVSVFSTAFRRGIKIDNKDQVISLRIVDVVKEF